MYDVKVYSFCLLFTRSMMHVGYCLPLVFTSHFFNEICERGKKCCLGSFFFLNVVLLIVDITVRRTERKNV